jgi:E3 ubiquitin-protein ligase BRE1
VKYLQDELRRYRHDLNRADDTIKALEREASDSNYRHSKIVADLERDVREKYSRLDEFVKSTDQEGARLRKDRDTMRQMYEQSNSLLSAAQKQISIYESKLASNEAALKTLNELISTLKTQIQVISQLPSVDDAPGSLQKALDSLRADQQLYIDELEDLGKAYEQLQGELSATQKKLAERDEQISRLLGEKLKAEFASSQIQKENESGLVRSGKIEEIAKHRVSESEAREGQLRTQLGELERKVVDRTVAADSYKGRLSEASSEIALLRSKIDRLQAESVDFKASNSQVSSSASATIKDSIEYEKRRLTEDLVVAKKKLDAYVASGVGIVKDLEEEVEIYKKLMKCNSCHTRDKNAVILKCMHCFCKQCLDIRLETRQRKCPNCGDAFGASDVKQIYL